MNSKIDNIREHKIRRGNIFFTCEIEGENRELFSLHFNDERELFYIFPTDSTEKIKVLEKSNWKIQRRDDHISFHKDGQVHTRFKQENRKKKEYRFNAKNDTNVFALEPQNVLPLSVHSFFLGSALKNQKELDIENQKILSERINNEFPQIDIKNNIVTWSLLRPQDFSILIFALGKDLNPNSLQSNHPISILMDRKFHQPILLPWSTPSDYYSETKIWIVFSSKTVYCPNEYQEIVENEIKNREPKAWHLHSYGVCPPWRELEKMK